MAFEAPLRRLKLDRHSTFRDMNRITTQAEGFTATSLRGFRTTYEPSTILYGGCSPRRSPSSSPMASIPSGPRQSGTALVPRARRASRAHGRELEAPLAAFKAAVAALPTREDALVDRLFALECLAKAGRDARQERDRLLPARRAAGDYLDESWEPDVPHANVLAQALATIAALDDDPPSVG